MIAKVYACTRAQSEAHKHTRIQKHTCTHARKHPCVASRVQLAWKMSPGHAPPGGGASSVNPLPSNAAPRAAVRGSVTRSGPRSSEKMAYLKRDAILRVRVSIARQRLHVSLCACTRPCAYVRLDRCVKCHDHTHHLQVRATVVWRSRTLAQHSSTVLIAAHPLSLWSLGPRTMPL